MSARVYAQQSASLGIRRRISFLSIKSNTYNFFRGSNPEACESAVASAVRWVFLAACILPAGWLAPPAAAQQDVFNVTVGGSVRQDSNLFRKPDGQETSETINSAYVQLRFAKDLSQQRFQFEATETAIRYANLSRLNYDALNYKGTWNWHVTPRISGTLSADRSKSLAPFEDTLGTQRNVSILENRAFNIDGWLYGGWHLLGGISQSDQSSEQQIQTQPDFRSVTVDAGVKYITRAGNSISAQQRTTDGKYQNLTVNPTQPDYTQDESELRATWALDGKSSMTGRLAWLKRSQDGAPQRDFSGPAGDIAFNWQPTGKLALAFAASRSTGPLQDPSFNSVVNDTLSFTPTWSLSAKTAVNLNLARKTLEYRGTGTVPATGPARSDTLDSMRIGFTWAAMRSLSVGASLETQKRSSNTPGFDYNATIGSINAALTF